MSSSDPVTFSALASWLWIVVMAVLIPIIGFLYRADRSNVINSISVLKSDTDKKISRIESNVKEQLNDIHMELNRKEDFTHEISKKISHLEAITVNDDKVRAIIQKELQPLNEKYHQMFESQTKILNQITKLTVEIAKIGVIDRRNNSEG